MQKILIIRFSSFGDIVQTLPCATLLKSMESKKATIHWLTRQDMAPLVEAHPDVDEVWSFNRNLGMMGLISLAFKLRKQKYDKIYDAHNNQRSLIVSFILHPSSLFRDSSKFIRRSKQRWKRFLLLKMHKNLYDWPFRNTLTYLKPLRLWTENIRLPKKRPLDLERYKSVDQKLRNWENSITLVPSAAWELKRWPLENWQQLVKLLPKHKWLVLGGANDVFCEKLYEMAPDRVLNLSGKLSWMESARVIEQSTLVVGNDTGITHLADYMEIPSLVIIGSVAFGYPTRKSSKILEVELACKPCTKDGRGRCKNKEFKKCFYEITPDQVAQEILTRCPL